MAADWFTADEDLEKLLEFDDLDRFCALDAGINRVPSAIGCISTLGDEVRGSTNSHKSSDAQACLPATGELVSPIESSADCGGSPRRASHCSKDNDSNYLLSRKRERAANEETITETIRKCHGAVDSTANPSGKLLTANHFVEGAEVDVGGEDVRLAGLLRDERISEAARMRRPRTQEASIQVSERFREDQNVSGKPGNGSTQTNELTRRVIDCNQGSTPVGTNRHGEAFRPLSSRPLSVAQEAVKDRDSHVLTTAIPNRRQNSSSEREVCPAPEVLKYKIPGPAGALQTYVSKDAQGANCQNSSSQDRSWLCERATAAVDDVDFRKGPWLAAMEFLENGNSKFGKQRPRSTIATVKAIEHHIPQLVGIIKTVIGNEFGDVSVTLKDPTGTINGSVHRRVLTELEDGQLIAPGAVIVLRKVAIFSPTPRSRYLNININNVDQIFGKDTGTPTVKAKVVKDHSRINNSHARIRDEYESEPNSSKFQPQRDTMQDHTLDNTEHRKETPTESGSPSPAKNPRESFLPGIVEGAVDLEIHAAGRNVESMEVNNPKNLLGDVQAELQANERVMGNVCGLDLSEDVELLLDDDFSFLP